MAKLSEIIYKGEIFQVEAYTDSSGKSPVVSWLDSCPERDKTKFAALFVRLADQGRIYDEKKFKHLTGTSQLFEFKVGQSRVISFFFLLGGGSC